MASAQLSAPSMIAFATVLQGNRTLRYFVAGDNVAPSDFEGSSLYGDVIQHLHKAIRLNTALVHLSLSKFALKDVNIKLLSSALEVNHTLVELDISRYALMNRR